MNPKDIIQVNNEKRKELTAENLAYYEDMLVFIRTSSNKSEQQTEEVLLELLEHLLEAQAEGRTAAEVFGDDPKEYCQEIIGEIPKEKNKARIPFFIYIVLQFLAIISMTFGIVGFGLYYLFDLGSAAVTFNLGSWAIILILYLLLMAVFIMIILKWLKKSTFKEKKTKKWVEFLQLWIISSLVICLYIFTPRFIPSFGTPISVPTIYLAGGGVILYVVSYMLNKKLRIIK